MKTTEVTDWKQAADELYMVVVGMMTATAQINGRSVEAAHERAVALRDEIVKANTRRRPRKATTPLSLRDYRALTQNWGGVWDWIYRHAELCEEPDDLRKLDRNAGRVGELLGRMKV